MIRGVLSSDGAFYANLKDLMVEGKIKIEEIQGEKIVYITDRGIKEFKESDEFLKKIIYEWMDKKHIRTVLFPRKVNIFYFPSNTCIDVYEDLFQSRY